MSRLAAQLLTTPESITVISVEPADWPDACLGLPAEGEICAMMIVPGYAVTLAVGANMYDFRTDASGGHIRVASAPPPNTGNPLVTWRDSHSFNMLIVGTQRIAVGRRGRPLIAAPLAVPEHAMQLEQFLARFAPFQARTPAGEISLSGVGAERASETDQRMIAEWARLISLEAQVGAEQPDADLALSWVRRGADNNTCDTIEISRSGLATASHCRGSESTLVAHMNLAAEDLAALYGWLDRLERFTARKGEKSITPGGVTTILEFHGTGVDEAIDSDQASILAWVDTVAVSLREIASR